VTNSATTATTEEYLEAIYMLQDEGQKVISARLAELWGQLGVPPGLVKAGQASLGDALAVGAQVPQSAAVTEATATSFMAGLHAGSAVAAGAALLAAIVAVLFLPQRDRPDAQLEEQPEQSRDLVKVE